MPQPILGNPNPASIGSFAGLADEITIGTPLPNGQSSKYIIVQNEGAIVFTNLMGALQYIPFTAAGSILPIQLISIVASGTVRGVERTTTASGFGWLGAY